MAFDTFTSKKVQIYMNFEKCQQAHSPPPPITNKMKETNIKIYCKGNYAWLPQSQFLKKKILPPLQEIKIKQREILFG